MARIDCVVCPAGCINTLFTHGYDSVIGVSFNLISEQWMLSVRVFGVETPLVKYLATHCSCDLFSVVTAAFVSTVLD